MRRRVSDPGPTPTGPTIFTVGHGARSIQEFLHLLQDAGVERLVDVRTAPGSRKHPHFGKDALAASLQTVGIEYEWQKELGGWRKPRADSRHIALRSPAFRGYADHMQTAQFREALANLINMARTNPTAVMCAESLWWRCHRRMLADALLVAGCRVVHLMPDGRQDPHRLNPSARVEGDTVVYDVRIEQGELLSAEDGA
jgi:uncharacterized protein (DUF488 family)